MLLAKQDALPWSPEVQSAVANVLDDVFPQAFLAFFEKNRVVDLDSILFKCTQFLPRENEVYMPHLELLRGLARLEAARKAYCAIHQNGDATAEDRLKADPDESKSKSLCSEVAAMADMYAGLSERLPAGHGCIKTKLDEVAKVLNDDGLL